jgi:outer membrane protein OmpA-like peptidoglycan-associated protein
VAQENLVLAEKTFDREGDTQQVRDEAYVAERKAELADIHARTTDYDQRANMAAHQVELTQARELERARSELVQTRERLAATTAAMSQLASMKTVQAVKQEDRGTVITLSGSVLFASAKYELLPSAEETLSQVAQALSKSDPDSHIVIQGYTDSQGGDAYNQVLSQHRADTVRAYLISHGIPSDRVTAEGFGPAHPVTDNATPEGRANNRRVEIVIQPPQKTQMESVAPTSTTTTSTTTVH